MGLPKLNVLLPAGNTFPVPVDNNRFTLALPYVVTATMPVSKLPLPTKKGAVTVPTLLVRPRLNRLPPVMVLLAVTVPLTVRPVSANTPTLFTPFTLTSTVSLGLSICTEEVPLAI